MEYACQLIDSIEDNVYESIGYNRNDILPIATTKHDKDIFVLTKPHSNKPGIVIWLAGEEIERFENFVDFFLAMIDYNRQELEEMKEE